MVRALRRSRHRGAIVRLSDGALGIVSGARHDPLGYDVRLELFGAAESIVVGVDSRSPIRSVEPGAKQPGTGYRNFVERFERAYREELATFVDTVRSGGKSVCTLEDAGAALSVALAADRSRRSGARCGSTRWDWHDCAPAVENHPPGDGKRDQRGRSGARSWCD